jgi:heterodisulfide reductase subunit C
MDLTFGEIFRAVAYDQPNALSNRTLWTCDKLLQNGLHCQNGLDIAAIVEALRKEAHLRGVQPDASP